MKKILNFEELDELAVKLAEFIEENDIIALMGDLGTGKTTFVKRIAKELGITENLKSPTFNYVLSYNSGEMKLNHFDVYRISEAEEIYEIGFEDYLHNGGLTIIEWANLIESELPKEYIKIELSHLDEFSRIVKINFIGNPKKEEVLLKYVSFSNWYFYQCRFSSTFP